LSKGRCPALGGTEGSEIPRHGDKGKRQGKDENRSFDLSFLARPKGRAIHSPLFKRGELLERTPLIPKTNEGHCPFTGKCF